MSNNKQSSVDKDFVQFEQALELKELGFDIPCYKYIYIGDTGINVDHYLEVEPSKAINYNEDSLCISQPTFSQSFRWFREKYKLYSTIMYRVSMEDNNEYWDWLIKREEVVYRHYKTYEEAELACLRKLIEIVKEKQNEQ